MTSLVRFGGERVVLRGTTSPLCRLYDVGLLDLDGVVYIGPRPLLGAPDALCAIRAQGMGLTFVTNNASRTALVIASELTKMGIPAEPEDVVSSAHAAASFLTEIVDAGARVLILGSEALASAVRDRGFEPVRSADPLPAAMVQGYGPDLDWWALAEGTIAVRRGVPWVATNLDATLPSSRGPLPGNGSLVAAIRHATGVEPSAVTGKPHPAMHQEAVRRSGAITPIVVGDRLDTDIEGANAVGCHSMLVLSGITRPSDLLAAPPAQRPTYLARYVGGLLDTHPEVALRGSGAVCGAWRASVFDGGLRLSRRSHVQRRGHSQPNEESDLDALRALCVATWRSGSGDGVCAAADAPAIDVLDRLGL